MSISRVKSAGWITNEKLTSRQMNAVDVNATYALDKRASQTDTLSSVITVASGGQLSFASGSSITSASGSTFTFAGTTSFITSVAFGSICSVSFAGAASFAGTSVNTFTSGSATTFNSGSTLTLGGTTRLATSSVLWQSSSNVTFGHVNNTASSGGGILTTISGQNCTGSTSSGGDIIITSGSGTKENGSVYLQVAGTNFIVADANNRFVQITKPTVLIGSSIYSAAKIVSYASSVSLDLNDSNVFVIGTLTGNITVTFSSIRDGGIYQLALTQDGTGGRTTSWSIPSGGSVYFGTGAGAAANASSSANKINVFTFLGRVIFGVSYLYCLSVTNY